MQHISLEMDFSNQTDDPILTELAAEERERQHWITKVAERDGLANLQHKDTDELKKIWDSKRATIPVAPAVISSTSSHNLFQQKSKVWSASLLC